MQIHLRYSFCNSSMDIWIFGWKCMAFKCINVTLKIYTKYKNKFSVRYPAHSPLQAVHTLFPII